MQSDNSSPSSSPLSIGFIGGSTQSAVGYAHFVSCQMDHLWDVQAGCFSTDAEANLETAAIYGVADDRMYDSWQEMLHAEKGRLDAILVLTPTPTHCEIVTACLESGFPVICEKALALNSQEAEKIGQVRDRTNGFVAVTYNYSGYPMVRELRNKIEKGELGEILHFQAEMPQEGFIRLDASGNKPVPQSWRLADGDIPTIYLDLAVHLHHLVYYLTRQSPVEVIAQQNSVGWFPEVIDNVMAISQYTGDVQGQFWFSKSALGYRNGLRLRVYGSKASAEWYQAEPEELLVSHVDGRREILDRASPTSIASLSQYNRFKSGHPAGFIEAFANLYRDMASCLKQYQATGTWDSRDVYSTELAVDGLHLLEAMVESCTTKTWHKIGD